ncbi:MAG: amidase domain-containing protein [Oscillospiraceae bacterium]|nr:amidase domain-containing protein [Oscillospiraceae bacterium]
MNKAVKFLCLLMTVCLITSCLHINFIPIENSAASGTAPVESVAPSEPASAESTPEEETPSKNILLTPVVNDDEEEEMLWPGYNAELHYTEAADLLDDDQLDLLYRNFDAHYEAMADLESIDLSWDFAARDLNETASMLIDQFTLDLTCEIRALRDIDLSLDDFYYGIKIESVKEEDGVYEIYLLENCELYFAELDGRPSYASGIEHTFVIEEIDGEWLILTHDRVEDLYIRITEQYEERAKKSPPKDEDELYDIFFDIYDEVITTAEEDEEKRMEMRDEYLDGDADCGDDVKYINEYDREAAVDYSYEWVDELEVVRDPYWMEFDGNCQNYASQCLYAGGISEDWSGYTQWKCFGGEVNLLNKPYGRSATWAGVDQFYQYCVYNQENGPATLPDANLYTAEPGDILQYAAFDTWVHTVVVSDLLYDDNGDVSDMLINSNTTERIDFPASAYAYSTMRLIRILGDNG